MAQRIYYFVPNAQLGSEASPLTDFAAARRVDFVLDILRTAPSPAKVTVLTLAKYPAPAPQPFVEERDGVDVLVYGYERLTVGIVMGYASTALRLMRRHAGPATLICYNFHPGSAVPSMLAKLRHWRWPYVVELEDGIDHDPHLGPGKRLLYRSILALQRRVATFGLVPSPVLGRYLRGVRTFVVTGVPRVAPLGAGGAAAAGLRQIQFAGKLDERRGVYDYLDLLAAGGLDDWRHHLCGSPTDPRRLQDAVTRAKTAADVSYHGRLSDTAFDNLMAEVDVVLSLADPTDRQTQETFPSKVAHALRAGKVVVSFPIAGFEGRRFPGLIFTEPGDLKRTLTELDLDEIVRQAGTPPDWPDERDAFLARLQDV